MRKPSFIARQSRHPTGWLGHIVARIMATETAPENILTLKRLNLVPGDRVLEVGCGHGHTLHRVVKRAEDITAVGIDHSEVMLCVARQRNCRLIGSGRISLDLGDSSRLPYPDASFTKVYSVHTIYFWKSPEAHLKEMLRVLTPGGRLVLAFRPADDPDCTTRFPKSVYHLRTAEEIEAMIYDSGFHHAQVQTCQVGTRFMNWIIAHKTAVVPADPGQKQNKGEMLCA